MALPPEGEAPVEAPRGRPTLHLVEASQIRERKCADCGKVTASWKPVRRKGSAVIVCSECAAKPPLSEDACPGCGAALAPGDSFCGKCGTRIEYACPQCGTVLETEDAFCGKCGARVV